MICSHIHRRSLALAMVTLVALTAPGAFAALGFTDPATVNTNARGIGSMTHRRYVALTAPEREVVSVLVPAERADELFDFIYTAAGIGEPHGGLMYQMSVPKATTFTLPADVPDEA